MTENALQLAARYYRALPIDRPRYEQVTLSLPVDKTALVGMHCWNIGCPDGPPVDLNYCVGMGWPQSTQEAGRIMAEVIRPAMDAARAIGMPSLPRRDGLDGPPVSPHRIAALGRVGIRTPTPTGDARTSPRRRLHGALAASADAARRNRLPSWRRAPLFLLRRARRIPAQPRRGYTHLHGIRSRHVPARGRGGSAAHAGSRLSLRGDPRCDRRGGDASVVPATIIDQLRPPHLRMDLGLRLHLRAIPTGHRSDER